MQVKICPVTLLYSRVPSNYTSIFGISLDTVLLGYLIASHILVTPVFFMELKLRFCTVIAVQAEFHS